MSDIPTSSTQPEFVALIGIDWGDKKHAWALQAGDSTRIEKGASIGSSATLLCGITIGTNAIVGAGSVVTKDVAPRTVVAGNPARLLNKLGKEESHNECSISRSQEPVSLHL